MSDGCEKSLGLRAGEYVEVRPAAEILATLDRNGSLEDLPFMPEMLRFCGKRLRVFKRADKTCDNIQAWSLRRVKDAVHLEGVRCDGGDHGACEAGCLIFWKEAWLKRVTADFVASGDLVSRQPESVRPPLLEGGCTLHTIVNASRRTDGNGETIYSCQATELRNFTSHLSSWDPRQYIRDLRSGNLASGIAGTSRTERTLEMALGFLQILQVFVIELFNVVQRRRHSISFPWIEGQLDKSPLATLDLQPGELVQVRTKEEIIATLDRKNRNRGLLFDSEMLHYCGGIYRVLRRVYRIIDEKTGRMLQMKNPCIILEGVACRSDYHRFCPRAIYHYWRENWLRRALDVSLPSGAEDVSDAVQALSRINS